MNIENKILNFCKKNRISSTEVADALGKKGVFKNVMQLNTLQNQYCVGRVRCIFTANKSNYDVHEQIKNVKEGDVVLIFTHNCKNHAIFGGLIAKYLLLYKLASAIVVEGKVRDAAYLKRENFSIWCEGVTPLGCYNKKTRSYPLAKKKKLINQFEGSIAICDECGVTIIPKKRINKEMFDKLQQIEIQEDLWFFCLDTLKWDTKKIVCDKAYLKDTELLSKNHIRNLSKLKISLDKKK